MISVSDGLCAIVLEKENIYSRHTRLNLHIRNEIRYFFGCLRRKKKKERRKKEVQSFYVMGNLIICVVIGSSGCCVFGQ